MTEPGFGELHPCLEPVKDVLSPRYTRLALALQTGHPDAYEELGTQDRIAGRRLYAAALRDVVGLSREEVAEACAYTDDGGAEVRRQIRPARKLWHRLGAWPWVCFKDGKPPNRWRQDWSGGTHAAMTLDVWKTETLGGFLRLRRV